MARVDVMDRAENRANERKRLRLRVAEIEMRLIDAVWRADRVAPIEQRRGNRQCAHAFDGDMIFGGEILHALHRDGVPRRSNKRYAGPSRKRPGLSTTPHARREIPNRREPEEKIARRRQRLRRTSNPHVKRITHGSRQHPALRRREREKNPHCRRRACRLFSRSAINPGGHLRQKHDEVNMKSMMNSRSQATRCCEMGVQHARAERRHPVEKDVARDADAVNQRQHAPRRRFDILKRRANQRASATREAPRKTEGRRTNA